ncbi:unnamed protein product [Cylindrotheca closterium]|uniref:Uncharacterized protein n=1 Tax=Cylindrotheca closterium TaxID=2856 RepID=A0AAD2CFL5_9STRA|nr:unnamed protein product [Cylindrotheca closterium]
MMTEINSIKTAFINIEAQLNTSGPLIIPEHPAYAYIRLLPKSAQQPEMRRALERRGQVQLDNVNQFETRYGKDPQVLDDSACFDELPEHMAEAVRLNNLKAILDFLGPIPISKRRLHAKCPAYSDDTLLHMTASYGNIPLMNFLLYLGADVNTPNLYQFTPLFHALVDDQAGVAARVLLRWGVRKVLQCSDTLEPSPPLAYVAHKGGKAAISELLKTPLGGRRCVLQKMHSVPRLNGQVGIVGEYDSEFNVYEVTMEKSGETIHVSSRLLKRCDQTPTGFTFKKINHHTLGEVARLHSFTRALSSP